ncbi:MAG: hypothetical protein J0H57_12360, partial [Rhodospirillales bacterium]|nr:hypothetical protein [Rhodospirillales bacterium]
MPPLIALAATFLPDLIKLLAGDRAGTIANRVVQTVQDVTGATDPVAARKALDADPQIAAALQQRLAELALEAARLQAAAADRQRQDELASFRAALADTAGARGLLAGLSAAHSPLALAAPTVSVLVSGGFFVVLTFLMLNGLPNADANTTRVVNLPLGVLGTAFATVVNFWLGSSSGSRDKDGAVLRLQTTQAGHTDQLLQTLQAVQQSHVEQTRTAIDALRSVAASPGTQPSAPATDAFARCVAVTLSQEGGYVDDPRDPGGATNLGITRATLSAWRGQEVGKDEVRALPREEAVEIYRANYWLPARCGDMPAGIDLMVFDCGVNAGPRTAVRMLQRLLGV